MSVPGIRGGQLRSVVAEFKIAAWRAMLGDDAWSMFNDKWLAKAIARGAMIRAVAIAAVVSFARRTGIEPQANGLPYQIHYYCIVARRRNRNEAWSAPG